MLAPRGISYFHCTDCFSGAKEFDGIFPAEREGILDRIVSLITTHKLRLIGYGIEEDAYKQYAPRPKRNEFGTNRYVSAFGGAIQSACESANPVPFSESNNVCDFYIENSDYKVSAAEAIQAIKQDEVLWYRHLVGNDTYGDKKGPHAIPLLQVADFGAFLANKHLTNAADGVIPWTKYYNALDRARLIWPIQRYSANCLKIMYGISALPKLKDDDF